YVDTRPNGEALRKCILSGPYKPTTVLVHVVETTNDSPAPEWSRFVTIVKQQHKLDEVSYHKLFDILKQYPNEVNELRAEKLARNANPLALVATAQARKEIAKPITPPSETAFEEDSDPNQAQRDKDMKKNLALIAKYFKKIYKPTNNNLRTSSNFKNKNVDMNSRYKNDDHSRQFGNQSAARENVGRMQKAKKSEGLRVSQGEDVVMQALIQSQWNSNTCLVETDDSNVTLDSPDMCEDDIRNEQNDVERDDERVALANLKLNVDENKKIQKQLKKANTTLAQELKECKAILTKTSKSLGESISVRDSCLFALQTKQAEFEKFKAFNDRTFNYDKLELVKEKHDELMKQSLLTKSHYEGLVKQKTKSDSLKFVHELKQEMHADLMYVESLEKEIIELKSEKAEFSDMYDVVLQECVSKDVMCSYLQSLSDLDALAELQSMYLHKVKECDCLAQRLSKQTESVSKKVHTELLQRFAKLEKHSISLEIALQKCKKQVKNDTVCNKKASNRFQKEREQYIKIQDLKAKLQDKNISISELKKLIEKGKGKFVDTKFDRPSVVRQPNAQRIPKPSILGKPTPFSNSLDRIYFQKTKLVPKANVSEGLSKPVTAQTLPQAATKPVSNTNVLKQGMYRIDNRTTHTKAPQLPQTVRNTNPRVSTSTGVNHKPTVSIPPLKSNQSRDNVLPNNSQVKAKKTQVEVHPRIPSVSNKIKSVTSCKDSLNSRTLNANVVCATYLEVAFRKSTCSVRDFQGNDLLVGNRGSDLYTISLQESTSSTPLCLMAKATPTR
nr:integrase, catalytic region, zinc finger, CCHC-type, peptidase aspartic, catalytic [Tanacetum cinerariifolium]